MNHAEFPPSRLEQYALCPASYHLQSGLPEVTSEASIEGTRLHAAVANQIPMDDFTSEQKELVIECQSVLDYRTSQIPGAHHETEYRLELKDDDGSVITWGTADAVIIPGTDSPVRKGAVIDWKFGYFGVTEAWENLQLETYAVALAQKFNLSEVDVIVYQPRIHRASDSSVTSDDYAHIIRNVKNIIEIAKRDDAPACPGVKQCKYCKARTTCPAQHNLLDTILAVGTSVIPKGKSVSLELVSDAAIVWLYEQAQVAEGFLKAVNDEMRKRLEQCGQLGNWTIKYSSGGKVLPNADKIFPLVSDVIDGKMLSSIAKVSLTDLKRTFCDEAVNGLFFRTKKEAEMELMSRLEGVAEHRPDKVSIVELK